MLNISRVLTGQVTAPHSRDFTKGYKQRYQNPPTIHGTPGLGINNTMEAIHRAVCSTARQRTGDTS
jgi:hypothetical protein